ncbi:MAG: hypothetical protein NZ890_11215, partial [Myxococcota bacterium]|nr:hypothetical protein [Myxococcota bacterium]
KAWVYAPSWKSPLGTNTDGTSGLGDNCGSYTYETAHLQWSGVAVSTGILNTTRWGVRFHGGSAALCNAALPIACCK